jgi:glycosyltransferase involved in cell wall biosynthesis
MPLPLSVVVVARNEAANLPRCLASVRGWAAEMVVALNGTTDASADLAAAAGATVHTLPWQGFRDTKNAALALARQPWILCLDADEEVSPELRAAIAAWLGADGKPAESAGQAWAGARFPRKVWFVDRWITHGDWYPDLSVRLVRAGRARWGGDAFVHERLECDGPVATLRADLHHYSFPTIASHVAKLIPFADLYVQQEQAAGRRFSAGAAVARPLWRFFRAYVLRRGFLDGFPGFYIAAATAFGGLVRRMRLYEAENRREPPAPPPAPRTDA